MSALTKEEALKKRTVLDGDHAAPGELASVLRELMVQDVNERVMIDSKIGFSVKALRKHGDATVAMLAKDLTEKWKAQVRRSASKGSSPKDAPKDAARDAPKDAARDAPKDAARDAPKDDAKDAGAPPAKKHKAAPPMEARRGPPAASGVDGKRGKVRDLLAKALELSAAPADAARLAGEVEEALWGHFDGKEAEYTAKVKSVKFNLQDPKNLDFRKLVCSGEISPASIPTLTPNQMAGKDKIEQKKANWQEATFQDQMFITAKNLGATSDMFQCGKCKKRECTFYQKQTRSADEPMTVFITCKACGHEWRDGG